jgi:multiple sugar transport system substrate-binding protein
MQRRRAMRRALLVLPGILLAASLAGAPAKVTLTYAAWNLGTAEENNLERRMLDAWNTENPDIQVVPAAATEPGDGWTPGLVAAAAAGEFPDVVMITMMPDYVAKGWLADLTGIAAGDPEWAKLPGLVRRSTTLNFRIYSVPYAQQMKGFFVNDDLLARNNAKLPDESWTIADFTGIVKKLTQPSKPSVGLAEEIDIPDWYPIAASSGYGWFARDDWGYHLDSAAYRAGIDLARSFFANGYVWAKLPDTARRAIGASWSGEAFARGYAALMWGTTAMLGEAAAWTFRWDFLPVPGTHGRFVSVPEYLGIGAASKSPMEAYALAKYMSGFSRKGLLKRIDLVKESGGRFSLGTLPLTRDRDILNSYLALMNMPSLSELFANPDDSVMDPFKWVPGYRFSRWDAPVTGDQTIGDMIWSSVRGDVKFSDVAAQLNRIANEGYRDAVQQLPPGAPPAW